VCAPEVCMFRDVHTERHHQRPPSIAPSCKLLSPASKPAELAAGAVQMPHRLPHWL
jgi:hypothetical protein